MSSPPRPAPVWAKNLLFFVVVALGLALAGARIARGPRPPTLDRLPGQAPNDADFSNTVARVDAILRETWRSENITPAPHADDLTIARRLSLALTGSIPSLEEIREFESHEPGARIGRWLEYLLADRRHFDYLAERLARAYVGDVEGPFVFFRRRRFVYWLADQLESHRPYDELARELISQQGLWTDKPATNFVTVTFKQQEDESLAPDEKALAARVSRAFLAKRIDCAECHDHPFDHWKQTDFQSLAAFFAGTSSEFTGIRDANASDVKPYRVENHKTGQIEDVFPRVPYSAELLPTDGAWRARLANWVTDPKNEHFSLAIVNRVWALLFGRAMVEPIDDIREGAAPEALRILAVDFAAHGFDLARLIRLIAATEAFGLDSRADESIPGQEITEDHERTWAAFPLVALRSEQVVDSILQASSLRTLGYQSNVVDRLAHYLLEEDFFREYGDLGENEFNPAAGTIPQRLIMMNGDHVLETTADKPLSNAATLISSLASSDEKAVELAYLIVLTRRPTPPEAEHFRRRLEDPRGNRRAHVLGDMVWTLLNSTEFAWNH